MENIDSLPFGIYKQIMSKAYSSLNNRSRYPYNSKLLNISQYDKKIFTPIKNTDLPLEEYLRRKKNKKND